jgi:GNAT superfamily N-acetyltransferase
MSIPSKFKVRQQTIGDMGIIASYQARYYHQKHQYNAKFEALVCHVAADFVQKFNKATDHCWIVEENERYVGSVMVMEDRNDSSCANIRMLYVVEEKRNQGIGTSLIRKALRFIQVAGYKSARLWSEAQLTAGSRIFSREEFMLSQRRQTTDWGAQVTSEVWTKAISS